MQLDMTKLRDAIAQLKAESAAAHARQEEAHAAQLTDGQAAIDAAAADVLAIVALQKADAPQPSIIIPAVVPFAPNTPGDAQTLLRAAMPGGAA